MRKPFYLKKVKRKKKYTYLYRLNKESGIVDSDEAVFHTTGQTSRTAAEAWVYDLIDKKKTQHGVNSDLSFRQYAEPYFTWDRCPHARRLREEDKSITRRHVYHQRRWLERYVLTDKIADLTLSAIRRSHLLDFRSRLSEQLGDKRTTINKTMGVVKTIFKEAFFREEIDRDPTQGIGNTKEHRREPGIFTEEEIKQLFPSRSFGPWHDIQDYACFLVAFSTGMRRGEILALRWRRIDWEAKNVAVVEAWKSSTETGEPKWGQKRTVPLETPTLVALRELEQDSVRVAPNDLVFCYDDGSRLGDTWWKKRFSNAMSKAGIDVKSRNITPHSFRHTLNTMWLDAGHDAGKVRAVLGWTQEKTQELYTHWQPNHFRGLAGTVRKILGE